jgi:colanic acid biosynthesis glycosyl transferase WcaI
VARGAAMSRATVESAVQIQGVADQLSFVNRLAAADAAPVNAPSVASSSGSAAAKPRIVFFNRSYWPDVEATGQLLTELAEDLADDFDVHVVAGQPNSVRSTADFNASGSQQHRGVTIHRVRHTRFSKHSLLGRLLNFLSFTLMAGWTSLSLPRPQVVITETDPFFLPWLGRLLQRFRRTQHVVYLQDIYPDIAVAVGKLQEGWLTRGVRSALFRTYRRADRVIVVSDDMRNTCLRAGLDGAHVCRIPNWADTRTLVAEKDNNPFRQQHGLDGKFVVMYSGNLGLAHQLQPILDAAELLRDRHDVQFLFVGEGARKAELERRVQELQLTNVRFLPYQPRETLSQSLSAADLHLVTVHPQAIPFLMPSKIYGVLASGTAVVAMTDPQSELARLVTESQLGYVCDLCQESTAAERLAFIIHFLADNPVQARQFGENARRVAEQQFDRAIVTARFGAELQAVLRHSASWNDESVGSAAGAQRAINAVPPTAPTGVSEAVLDTADSVRAPASR